MFKDCSSLVNINLTKFNTNNVINIEGIFMGCTKLMSVDLKNFNTSNVKNVNKMFYGCNNLKKFDISSFRNNTWTLNDQLFDKSLSKNGKISIGLSFYNNIIKKIPLGWKVVKILEKNINISKIKLL